MDPLAGDQAPDTTAPPPAAAPQINAAVPATTPTEQPTIASPSTTGYVEPPRRGGLAGVMDTVLDFLAHRDPDVTYDDTGRHTAPGAPLTTGQKVGRIAGTALTGAARGLAAPPGAAHVAQGAAAGVMGEENDAEQRTDKQDATAQQAYDAAQKAKLNNINYQLGIRAISKNDLELKAMGVKATQDQVNFSNAQVDRERTLGSYDLGTVKDVGEIADTLQKLPDWQKQLYQHEGIQPHPVYDENGARIGIQIFMRKPDVDNQPAPEGTKVNRFVPPAKPGDKPTVTTFTPVGATNGDIDKYNRAFLTDSQAWQKNQADADLKASQKKKADVDSDPAKVAADLAKTKAETSKANADASKANADAAKSKAETADGSTIDAIGTGHITVDRLGYLLARNPDLVQQVTAKYPDFDSSKAAAYPAVYKEFTSTKNGTPGNALNSGATALKHLKELSDMNTVASHIPGTPAYNAYSNKVDTVAPELAKFYGDATVPAIASIKSTLSATLPGNRQAAIQTQAKSMGDKFDSYEQTWTNAAPSKAYEAQMPGVDEKAIEARAALDPAYRQRIVAQQAPAPAAVPIAAAPPATHVFSPSAWKRANPNGDVNAAIAAAKAQKYTVVQ